ncbi:hypothetical protein P154DRAFT_434352 [Amniculicola lignicola CBS 123094]|uniref:Uncharacterized protein n=1 Tax=Amniculicola lignicola CBS 123094 TaxID=1392246 RepID=A0A6A5WKL6_9PLEO|nr:hypothetical protein P154DRAFT_434352 [Amniculicola lignicola CBS 123094]
MVLLKALAVASLASVALASPFQLDTRGKGSPCAQVAASVATQTIAVPTVPAQLAYECITSVPLNKTAALALIDGIIPYVRWQSTTAWLKNPTREYVEKLQNPVDVWGGLSDITNKVKRGVYTKEFESTHDGHFVYIPDVVGAVFNYARPLALVSVSEDGKKLPKPYVYQDILATSVGKKAHFKASSIVSINGQDALEYLENWSQYGSLQDRDALYNNVFYELAVVSLGSSGAGMGTFSGGGRGRWVYPGPETTLKFANGTKVTFQNYAKVLVKLDGVTDGASLYKKWFTYPKVPAAAPSPTASASVTPTSTSTPTATATPAPGYPPPVIREPHNLIGGYYLDGDYSDVAVLSIPSFSYQPTFASTAEKFLAAAKAAGKKKLVVDVSANGGGTILQGYDIYKQIFPKGINHAAADRFRAFESTNIMGQKFSDIASLYPRVYDTDNETLLEIEYNIISDVLNYRTPTKLDLTPFKSWKELFGPHPSHGDQYTSLFRWNLTDVLTPINGGIDFVHNEPGHTNYSQAFAAEDVVVVTDGYCASTCTIFSELMRQRQGVKYISLGGRSRPGITQAIGGVKGTNNLGYDYIQFLVQMAFEFSTKEEQAKLNKTQLAEYYSNVPFDRLAPGTGMAINFRDGIRDGDATDTPLQFVYEPSDCRILYTKEMTVDVTTIWKAVTDTAWGKKNHCIAGGLGDKYGKEKRDVNSIERTAEDVEIVRRMVEWKRELSEEDYPLDVFTDLREGKLGGDGVMDP